MALEFNKVTEQVERMGRMIGELDFEVGDRLQLARQRFFAASDLDFIHRRIALVRGPEVSGYRGAAPLDAPYHEPVCQVHPLPADPGSATIVASDGSQIYPSEQWRIPYYLTNVGLFVYYHGQERVPDHLTAPRLVYHPDHVRDKARRVLSNRTIDALRTVREMRELARLIWDLRSAHASTGAAGL